VLQTEISQNITCRFFEITITECQAFGRRYAPAVKFTGIARKTMRGCEGISPHRKKHKALRKKHKPYILKYKALILK